MHARPRKERWTAPSQDEMQLWQKIRASLRVLETLRTDNIATHTELAAVRSRLAAATAAEAQNGASTSQRDAQASKAKQEMRSLYNDLKNRADEEEKTIDQTLENLSVLTALRGGAAADDPKDGRSAQRKKRRIDGGSTSPRTSPSLTPAPAPSPAPRAALKATSTTVDATPNKARGAATPGGRSGGSTSYMDPAKARREVLQGQLPLTPGRKVAFRQPSKAKATTGGAAAISGPTQAPADEEGETWIMAIVKECINNDRNRYVVVDAEDVDGQKYNTTLKAIVPLPESLSTLPTEDYRPGSIVLGLYPDTSCFYKAKVIRGGPGLNGRQITAKLKSRTQEMLGKTYELQFEEDGDNVHSVPASLVVERP